MEHLEQEIWKSIPFSSSYEVSSLGRVRHHFKNGNTRYLKPLRRDLHPGKNYVYIEIKGKKHYVHRLVAQAFLEDFDVSLTVDHINEIQDDNRASNLRMCTRGDNIKYYKMNHPKVSKKDSSLS